MTAIQDFLEEHFLDYKDDILFADGFEDAFMGIVTNKGHKPTACYDYHKCVGILCKRDGMLPAEAYEYMEVNVVDAYVGEYTPSFIDRFDNVKKHYGTHTSDPIWLDTKQSNHEKLVKEYKERMEFFEDSENI